MRYPNRGKKQFTEEEKRAFHGGRAFAAGKAGKRVRLKTEAERKSFRNGIKTVTGGKK